MQQTKSGWSTRKKIIVGIVVCVAALGVHLTLRAVSKAGREHEQWKTDVTKTADDYINKLNAKPAPK